jgi:hypothetical protein
MRELTMEDKKLIITTTHWTSEYNFKLGEKFNLEYGDTGSYKMIDVWLSQILNLDFRKDIYNNSEIFEINKIDRVKDNFKVMFNRGWFIGDSMHDVIFALCYHNVQDEAKIEEAEKEIKFMLEYFVELTPKFSETQEAVETHSEKELFVDAGVTLNGEKLYRKVEK